MKTGDTIKVLGVSHNTCHVFEITCDCVFLRGTFRWLGDALWFAAVVGSGKQLIVVDDSPPKYRGFAWGAK